MKRLFLLILLSHVLLIEAKQVNIKDGVNVYKAKNIDEFEQKIVKMLEGKLKNLTEEAYKVALERDIKKIGKRLIEIYKKVLKEDSYVE